MGVIAYHESPRVVPLLEQWAGRATGGHDLRKHAIFWLGVRGGERGFQFLRAIVRNDGNSPGSAKSRAELPWPLTALSGARG